MQVRLTSIVGDSIAFRTIVLDIAEHFVGSVMIERRNASMLHFFHPIRATTCCRTRDWV
jgi:hypothetical protein